jgi:hypothetical protein
MEFKIDVKFGALALSAIFLVILGQIVPVIGQSLDGTVEMDADSEWNVSNENSTLPDVPSKWASIFNILATAITLSAIFYAVSPVIGNTFNRNS